MSRSEYGWIATPEHKCMKPYLWFAKAGQKWRCGRKIDATGERCGKLWEVIVDPDHGDPKKLAWREVAEPKPDARLERFERVDEAELWYWLTDEMDLRTRDQDVSAETLIEAVQKHFVIGKVQ